MFSDKTLQRMARRVDRLESEFNECLEKFERANLFTGPSVYFHTKTLEILRNQNSAADAVQNENFLESLYATLTAWGLHRIGPGNTKLNEFRIIKESFSRNVARI